VRDLDEAVAFYDAWLPELGFTERYHGPEWKVWATTDELPAAAYFAVTASPTHEPNENRLAFWARDRGEVDRLAVLVAAAGAMEVSGPKEMPYGPDYYAVFFADPAGNRLEVYHRLAG
jgi:catechol 2,3-dioxygenase-like lactoylglutathione lyase family enzyme